MRAVITEDCRIAPEGYIVITMSKGQEICGDLAEYCVRKGHAKEIKPEPVEPEVKKTPKPKTRKPKYPKHEG